MGDLFRLDPEALQWTDLTAAAAAAGPTPVGRDRHGFAGAAGVLYLFGGYGGTGARSPTILPPL